MPLSNYKITSKLMLEVKTITGIKSVLDVGAGFGKYGVLLREHLDISHGRYAKEEWQVVINAIEYYKPYITPLHKYIYNEIFISDVYDIVDFIQDYDCILIIDCIEHMNKSKGKEVLRKLYNKCNKLFLISFPTTCNKEENSCWPNHRETHRCLWTVEELQEVIGPVNILSNTLFSKVKK